MADNVIQYMMQAVNELLQQELSSLLSVKDEVNDLASQIDDINSFLRNSEGKQYLNREVRQVIQQIKGVKQEAEDAMEDLMYVIEKHWENTMGKILNRGKQTSILHDVAKKTKEINKTITNVYNSFELYGIKMNDSGKNNDPALLRPELLMTVQRCKRDAENEMVGRRDVRDQITTKLTAGRPELDFVSIVGTGGLAKTTLAKTIDNDVAIRNRFTCRGWAFVSQEYDISQVVLSIIKSVMPDRALEALKKKSEEQLKCMLRDHLQSERYLIVLDDTCKPVMWDEIRQAFQMVIGVADVRLFTKNMDLLT